MMIPIVRRGVPYLSRDVEPAGSLQSAASAETPQVGLAPGVMIADDASWWRDVAAGLPTMPARAERSVLLLRALDLFAHGRVDVPGLGAQDAVQFEQTLLRRCGLPPGLTRRWSATLQHLFVERSVAECETDKAEAVVGGGLEVVSLPANTFVCLEAVGEALLRADAVWVRPSRREPFSAARLLGCLMAVGWPAARLGLYATRPDALSTLVRVADRAVVFGGSALPPALSRCPQVDFRGPGRARALVADHADPVQVAARLLPLMAADAGRFCSSVGTILCSGGTDLIGRCLADGLDQIRLGLPEDARFPQALAGAADAAAWEAWIAARLRPGDRVLTQRPLRTVTDDGCVVAPSLISVADVAGHPLLGLELPFPVAAIAHARAREHAELCAGAGFVHVLDAAPAQVMAGLRPSVRVFHHNVDVQGRAGAWT
ncbi:MAG: aldehyde dehydrogenase family protein [Burkholderiales bacterium]|jgi:hypothetical protein|nr:aldehyde dehydrogenase family protein [Burkholderiales bacterium]